MLLLVILLPTQKRKFRRPLNKTKPFRKIRFYLKHGLWDTVYMAVIYVMRSKLSQKRTSTIITNVCVVLYSLFLFMLKIYAFVGVFIAITALKGNKEFPNLHFEYLQLFFFFINHFVPIDLPLFDYVSNNSTLWTQIIVF